MLEPHPGEPAPKAEVRGSSPALRTSYQGSKVLQDRFSSLVQMVISQIRKGV